MKRTILFLLSLAVFPACRQVTQKTTKSQRQDVVGSSFVKPSEQEIRDDLRLEYAQKHKVISVAGKNACEKKRRLSRRERVALVSQRAKNLEARLVDVPIPLQAEPIETFFDDECVESVAVTLGYTIDMSAQDLIAFYQREMDRHGWQCLSDLSGKETLASFVKPARVCSVSIRPQAKKGGSDLVIFAGPAKPTCSS